jgi:hypothetical protein
VANKTNSAKYLVEFLALKYSLANPAKICPIFMQSLQWLNLLTNEVWLTICNLTSALINDFGILPLMKNKIKIRKTWNNDNSFRLPARKLGFNSKRVNDDLTMKSPEYEYISGRNVFKILAFTFEAIRLMCSKWD